MEDFNKKLDELRNEVIANIKKILHPGESHTFVDGFYCTILLGDDAPITECGTIKNDDGKVMLHTVAMNTDEEYDDEITKYETETIIYCYEQLTKELRKEKIDELRSLINLAGGHIAFDGTKDFLFCDNPEISDDMDATLHYLDKILLKDDGVEFSTSSCDEIGSYRSFFQEQQIPDVTLDQIIAYVKEKTKPTIDISLTEEQECVVNKFKDILFELGNANVVIIEDHTTGAFKLVNGDGIKYATEYNEGFDDAICVDDQLEGIEEIAITDVAYFSDSEEIRAKEV